MAALRVVLLINPVAGLGGTVALKGSDGQAVQQEALAKGARPQALERASVFLRTLLQEAGSQSLTWWARPGDASLLKNLGFVSVTPFAQAVELDADATRNTIAEMPSGVECVVFVDAAQSKTATLWLPILLKQKANIHITDLSKQKPKQRLVVWPVQ